MAFEGEKMTLFGKRGFPDNTGKKQEKYK